jgi:hypothetical protein
MASSSAATMRSKSCSANCLASSKPIPLEAPVTTARSREDGDGGVMARGVPRPRCRHAPAWSPGLPPRGRSPRAQSGGPSSVPASGLDPVRLNCGGDCGRSHAKPPVSRGSGADRSLDEPATARYGAALLDGRGLCVAVPKQHLDYYCGPSRHSQPISELPSLNEPRIQRTHDSAVHGSAYPSIDPTRGWGTARSGDASR